MKSYKLTKINFNTNSISMKSSKGDSEKTDFKSRNGIDFLFYFGVLTVLMVIWLVFPDAAHAELTVSHQTSSSLVKSENDQLYYDLRSRFMGIYGPILKAQTGLELDILLSIEVPNYFGGMKIEDQTLKIILGSEAHREKGVRPLGYLGVLCHEVGHRLGGPPFKTSESERGWSSTEGQSDFYAASVCLPKIIQTLTDKEKNIYGVLSLNNSRNFLDSRGSLKDKDLFKFIPTNENTPVVSSEEWSFLTDLCLNKVGNFLQIPSLDREKDIDHLKMNAIELCINTALAGRSFVDIIYSVYLDFPNPPPRPVLNTPESAGGSYGSQYPSMQCRLDTFMRGAAKKDRALCWYNPQN